MTTHEKYFVRLFADYLDIPRKTADFWIGQMEMKQSRETKLSSRIVKTKPK